jgi:cytochrome c
LTRAERDERYEKMRHEFPEESSDVDPVKLWAKTKPKTIEDVQTFRGYEEVSGMVPVSNSTVSIQSGQELYNKVCAACHLADGPPKNDVYTASLAGYNMADLSDPLQYKYGADARGIFRSIAFGVPAPPHGAYKKALSEQQIWNLTNFVISLQADR